MLLLFTILGLMGMLVPLSAQEEHPMQPGTRQAPGNTPPYEALFGSAFPRPDPEQPVVVPILMYHHVRYLPPEADRTWRELTVDPVAFEAQMAYLVEHGYHTISFTDLADFFDRGKSLPQNPVILTFDDGWEEQYTTVLPILRRYGLTATFFPPTQWVNSSNSTLTWAQIEEMSAAGMAFGSHTVNHYSLPQQTHDEARQQLSQSKAVLEAHIHKPVIALAYPEGNFSPAIVQLAAQIGFRVAVGTRSGVEQRPVDRFALCRISVGYGTPLQTFVARLPVPSIPRSHS